MEKMNLTFPKKAYFAAANSGYGFYSFYDEIFGGKDIVERFILKGGPGTGKSRFMKDIAYRAERLGYDTEIFYCSSDPTSLDGIIVDVTGKGRVCVLDGTAPHVCEATLPGARDNIINLGEFWHSPTLKGEKEQIRKIGREKYAAYLRAEETLRSLLLLYGESEKDSHALIREEKLKHTAHRFFSGVDADENYYEKIGLRSSFGMFGECSLDTYSALCDDLVIIDDSLGVADAFLSALLSLAREYKVSTVRSYQYLNPHKLDALYLPSLSLSFIASSGALCPTDEKCRKKINMQRFFESDAYKLIRSDIRSSAPAVKELKAKAENEMEKMRKAHFALEDIYIAAMDFDRKEAFCNAWIEENL